MYGYGNQNISEFQMQAYCSENYQKDTIMKFCKAAFKDSWGGCIQLYTFCNFSNKRSIPIRIASFSVSQIHKHLPRFYEYIALPFEEREAWLNRKNNKLFKLCIQYYLKHYSDQFPLVQNRDYYITANGLKPHSKHEEKDLISLQNIVIDIDRHSKEHPEDAQSVYRYCRILSGKIEAELGCFNVAITAISYTGRGMHLWFSFESASAKHLKEEFKTVYKKLRDLINDVIRRNPELGFVTIDSNASSKLAGLFRLPASYNEKAIKNNVYGVFGECEIIEYAKKLNINTFLSHIEYRPTEDRCEPTLQQIRCLNDIEYNLNLETKLVYENRKEADNLIKELLNKSVDAVRSQGKWIQPPTENQLKVLRKYAPDEKPSTMREAYDLIKKLAPKKDKKKYTEKKGNYAPLMRYRLDLIKYDIRYKNAPIGSENRDLHLYAFFNTALQIMDKQSAITETEAVNRMFKEPLDAGHIYKLYENHEPYKFKQETFFDLLNISKEETDSFEKNRGYSKYYKSTNDARSKERFDKRVEKLTYALNLYDNNKNLTEIEKTMRERFGRFSRQSFRKYLSAYQAFLSEYNTEYLPRITGSEYLTNPRLADQIKADFRKYHDIKKITQVKLLSRIREDAIAAIIKNKGHWSREYLPYLPKTPAIFRTAFKTLPVTVKKRENGNCEHLPKYPSLSLTDNSLNHGREENSMPAHALPGRNKTEVDKNTDVFPTNISCLPNKPYTGYAADTVKYLIDIIINSTGRNTEVILKNTAYKTDDKNTYKYNGRPLHKGMISNPLLWAWKKQTKKTYTIASKNEQSGNWKMTTYFISNDFECDRNSGVPPPANLPP